MLASSCLDEVVSSSIGKENKLYLVDYSRVRTRKDGPDVAYMRRARLASVQVPRYVCVQILVCMYGYRHRYTPFTTHVCIMPRT